jgi:N-methylhydantoinase A
MTSDARVGVDIGGTFTDLVLLRSGKVVAVGKTLTTPQDPSEGVVHGLEEVLRRSDTPPRDIVELVHGTTLVANALIERKGASTLLITTRGFRDALAMRREHRYDIYDLALELPEPLVPRRLRWEVSERVLVDGTVLRPLDPDDVRVLARRARRERIESIAVSFLHSYRHPQHERLAQEILAEELPGLPVSISSDMVSEPGEYVRTSTVAANAYVRPLMNRYLGRLDSGIRGLGISAPLRLMLSTGGLASIDDGRRYPLRMCESGPAAGAIAAAFFGTLSGEDDVLAFDMGGTTAKACLIEHGRPLLAREHEVARVNRFAKESGLPLRLPVVDLIEIGAGGGSIAFVDQFGLPRVGPESAGAEPGPACYGRNGLRPTVTDADLILGYLNPTFFLGGDLVLDTAASEQALSQFGATLGLPIASAAAAVHEVVDENMAGAARIHAIERGRDVRNFTLVATGGAGPVHAWSVARRLGLKTILYPPSAGVASAFGMLTASPSFDYAQSMPSAVTEISWGDVRRAVNTMVSEGRNSLDDVAGVEISVDVRFRGQGDAISVELGSSLNERAQAQLVNLFEAAYRRLYGRTPPGVDVEVTTWRVKVSGPRPLVILDAEATDENALKGRRKIWSHEKGAYIEASVWNRYALAAGSIVQGPAVVEERESSAVIGIGGRGVVDRHGSLKVERR